jgi:hypothetical protein
VSDLLQIVSRLEESGGTLVLDRDRIRYSVPSGDAEARALLAELRKHRSEIAAFLRDRQAIPEMPQGVRLIQWTLKEPPVAIETCSVVTDPALFARTTLEQLRTSLAHPKRWVGWSVPQLIDRLAQVGVSVALECAERIGEVHL